MTQVADPTDSLPGHLSAGSSSPDLRMLPDIALIHPPTSAAELRGLTFSYINNTCVLKISY